MIINNKPESEAVLSNVASVGEFRIRNSAKAFNILSSGLYANKIRAVIRELSCNAVDSHVAAGRVDTPFEVHLPNRIEPWFSVRDFGVGLSHEQVINIYTTYFESTKTDSNAFIGALGLGSKSPFSYTENFTVTAIQNGVKGVYTAFINDQGVPSIALMATENTDEPNGVEVKFGVDNDNDFWKFKSEAQEVYRWFQLKPVITGTNSLQLLDYRTELDKQDVYPGIHVFKRQDRGYSQNCVALMGNIAYPIEVPNAQANMGHLEFLLHCNLLIEFGIGEIEFQASREGLSYVPSTIAAIRTRLAQLNSVLVDRLTEEVNKLTNTWDQGFLLANRCSDKMWRAAAAEYVKFHASPMFDLSPSHGVIFRNMGLKVQELAEKFNIKLQSFHTNYRGSCATLYPDLYAARPELAEWRINYERDLRFVIHDTKVGCFERAKNHFRANNNYRVVVITAADRNQPMKVDEFLSLIHNPPAHQVFKASELKEVERKQSVGKDVSLLKMGWTGHYSNRQLTWQEAGVLSDFDTAQTYVYLPLTGFALVSKYGTTKPKELVEEWQGFTGKTEAVYGVRKKDIEAIQQMPNWVNLEDLIIQQLNDVTDQQIQAWVLDTHHDLHQLAEVYSIIKTLLNPDCEFAKLVQPYCKDIVGSATMLRNYQLLCQRYPAQAVNKYEQQAKAAIEVSKAVINRYPMLQFVAPTDARHHRNVIVNYIKQIDQQ